MIRSDGGRDLYGLAAAVQPPYFEATLDNAALTVLDPAGNLVVAYRSRGWQRMEQGLQTL